MFSMLLRQHPEFLLRGRKRLMMPLLLHPVTMLPDLVIIRLCSLMDPVIVYRHAALTL
jgi:hypothetical protein